MEEGFRVGGKSYPKAQHWKGGQFPVANGAAHGQGVYSATSAKTPMQYSRSQGSGGQIILVRPQLSPLYPCTQPLDGRHTSSCQAMALKGDHGHGSKMASTHDSWDCGGSQDWIVFKDDEQVLPMYVVYHD